MDEETAYKLTVDDMRKKLEEECNKQDSCAGCSLRHFGYRPCYAGDDESVKQNYTTMFSGKTGIEAAVDQLKEGMEKVIIPCDNEPVQEIIDDATLKIMREKIKKHCDECNYCEGCPIYDEPGTDCYDTPAQIIKHYAMLFGDDNNAVDHPAHYCYSKYEPKDVIRGWGLNFNLGSAVKYIARAGRKDDIIQDLEKAKKFLEFEIEALKEEREDGH